MLVKPGVQLSGLHYGMWYAAALWDYLLTSNGYDQGTISGGREGADLIGPARVGGEHNAGIALDLRRPDWPSFTAPDLVEQIVTQYRRLLGPSFQVIVERDHVHVDLYPAGTLRA